jgi:uncharacterized protein
MPASAADPVTCALQNAKTIAVVGLSNSPFRPSHGVAAYMQSHGYRIIPVNPEVDVVLGEKSYASLLEVPERVDIVNIFRRSEFVPEVVDQALQIKAPTIWMQEGVLHDAAAAKARRAGILVVMDSCILKEHRARLV